MSLIVKNAYRYTLVDQRAVHDVLMRNAASKTSELVSAAVASLDAQVGNLRDEWVAQLTEHMMPSMPKKRVSRTTERLLESGATRGRFLRAYLLDYHRFVEADVTTWTLIDTVMSWTYTWDEEFGYVVLYLPLEVSKKDIVKGAKKLMEPFDYDGRTGMTNNRNMSAEEVSQAWDRVVGNSSPGFVGATARLGGYELAKAFGTV